ncbi:MAG: hypothetical protein DI586_00945 [Micavibrio aeruginosavorus]|uniref:rRNA methyltransferase n=1 Tax=Micavibrio aeruginosavorus TaxID=349221 RepID=A0A2W5FTX2_9BACT|nr:MAG: hypothetical protein DI586_00945 [Micavibrio aeruginosavorus]
MQLPANLRARIDALLSSENKKFLSSAAQNVSLKYRRESSAPSLQISSMDEAKAYVATRLPATWCAVTKALQAYLEIDPEIKINSILDLGAGPGTAALAAQNIWPDCSATLFEPNPHLSEIGQKLFEGGDWQNARLQNISIEKRYDLVLSSYVLNEIDSDLEDILQNIWAAAESALVIIEPGTPLGYSTILRARDYFTSIGANIAAPCPHESTCPLRDTDKWCHFSVRVDRSRLHLQTKPDARLSYEDEKFSYLIVTRHKTPKPRLRALGQPHGQKVVTLETCQDRGQFEILQLSRRDSDYKLLRKIDWGDAAYPVQDKE